MGPSKLRVAAQCFLTRPQGLTRQGATVLREPSVPHIPMHHLAAASKPGW